MSINETKKIVYRKIKSLIKDHPTAVDDALLGLAMTNKGLVVLENQRIIMRRDHKSMTGKVKIIAGGGAGLEPADACYVGSGMLTAVVVGDVFTAPSAETILIAIRELAGENSDGILLLVKNYTGDRLNFGLAYERALKENIPIKMLIIGDDASEWKPGKHGRRGLAGCVMVYKIAGGMADFGKSLDDIFEECRNFCLTDLSTVSATLSPCSHLGCTTIDQLLKDDEMILGLGSYGQHGVKDMKITNINEVVRIMLDVLSNQASQTHIEFDESPVAVLINNLGSTTKLEEWIFAMEVLKQLSGRGIKVIRQYSGTFMPSMDAQGFSVSILKITCADAVKYLDSPTSAPGWPRTFCGKCAYPNLSANAELTPVVKPSIEYRRLSKISGDEGIGPVLSENASLALDQIAAFACEALISCEKQLDTMDFELGDGDTGKMLKKGAEALKTAIREGQINTTHPYLFLQGTSEILSETIGGTSGALYSIFFNAASKIFKESAEITPLTWSEAFKAGVKAVKCYGNVEIGDRSLIDALEPASEAFETALNNGQHPSQAIYRAAAVGEFKAEETKSMTPVYGRPHKQKNKGLMYPDPGAYAAAIWLRAISEGVRLKYPPC